jgi:hypothetical protein
MSNQNIRNAFNEEFIKDTNPHKFAILWAGKFYGKLNKIMYNKSLDEIKNDYPYTFYYIKNFIKYFYTHGFYKKSLIQNKVSLLFRGIKKDFDIKPIYKQNSFMSTSWDFNVAEGFAEDKGSILIFRTKDLPEDIPMVVIDERICDYLNESEILFLPYCDINTILQKSKNLDKHLKETKTINYHLGKISYNLSEIKKYINIDKMKGGNGNIKKKHVPFERFFYDLLKPVAHELPKYTLTNKTVFFYRAIKDRPVQILKNYECLEETEEGLYRFSKFRLESDVHYYNNITNFIPEVQDLKEYLETNRDFNDPVRKQARDKLDSYNVYVAIYNPILNKIDDLYYGFFKFMYKECGIDSSRDKEIETAIYDKIQEMKEFEKNHPELLESIDDFLAEINF